MRMTITTDMLQQMFDSLDLSELRKVQGIIESVIQQRKILLDCTQLDQAEIDLIQDGKTFDAIKRVRERCGSLMKAKEIVDYRKEAIQAIERMRLYEITGAGRSETIQARSIDHAFDEAANRFETEQGSVRVTVCELDTGNKQDYVILAKTKHQG